MQPIRPDLTDVLTQQYVSLFAPPERDFCMPLLGASICTSSRKSSRSFPEDQVLDSQSSKIVPIITVNGILCPNGLTKDSIFLPQDISVDLFQHCIVHHVGDDYRPWVRVWSVSQEIKLEFQPPFQLYGHCMEVSISDSISFLSSPCISSAQCIPVSSLSVFQQYSGLGLFCSSYRTIDGKGPTAFRSMFLATSHLCPRMGPLLAQLLIINTVRSIKTQSSPHDTQTIITKAGTI